MSSKFHVNFSIVDWVLRVCEVKDDNAVGSGTATSFGEDLLKINGTVEAERPVVVDIDPMTLVITGSVDN